jgi:hypothetical protein
MDESMTVDVTFSPTSVGEKTANLHIVDNLTKTEHDIPLTGDGWDVNYGGGGTAQGGYYFANSLSIDAPSHPTYNWIDISGTGTDVYGELSNGDGYAGGTEGYDIGFTFPFFGGDYTKFWLAADGFISLGTDHYGYSNQNIPSTTAPNCLIALFWDDLNPDTPQGTSYLYYETVGNTLVITYDHFYAYSSASPDKWFTAQAILYQDGRIKLQYKEKGPDMPLNSCTVGIENLDGTQGINYLYNGTGGSIYPGAKDGEVAVMFGTDPNTLPVVLVENSFMAIQQESETGQAYIQVKWETASESDILGFNLYRSETDHLSEAGQPINSELIRPQGSTSSGHPYTFDDWFASAYDPHSYWLEVVNIGAPNTFEGPIKYEPGDTDGDGESDEYPVTKLDDSYPNPVVDHTTIKYQLKGSVDEQDAEIRIYNIRGQLVQTIQGKAGVAVLDASSLSNGIYFYRLKTETYDEVKKLMVVR